LAKAESTRIAKANQAADRIRPGFGIAKAHPISLGGLFSKHSIAAISPSGNTPKFKLDCRQASLRAVHYL
jgi:hypothetical protein